MIIYNKLVRDRIPEIIESSGKKATVARIPSEEYYKLLLDKLFEEVKEFAQSDNPEEIADILEVLDAILKEKNLTWEVIKQVQDKKRIERGGFDKRIMLIKVEDI